LKTRARKLRKNSTDAERLLWRHLRDRRLRGYKFRRQHVIGHYIVDFVCPVSKLIVEVDGGQHADRMAYDASRTRFMASQGFRVARFWNHDVLRDVDSVLSVILRLLEEEGG
jgi:adenine-specific DNA-methyltransferase